MKVLSKSSEYGLRALLYMVGKEQASQSYIGIREMSETLDISFHFLTKILQALTQAQLLLSYRGPNGGVAFRVPPEQITLGQVIRVLEGDDFFETCILGLPGCGSQKPCPLHRFWAKVRTHFQEEFDQTSVAELGHHALLRHLRLAP